jgi:hypothetical protein
MRKFIATTVISFCLLLNWSYSATSIDQAQEKSMVASIGFLQGGGSLLGVDIEMLATPELGVQVGAGFIGLGAGLIYHFKPSIMSDAISLSIWNQGLFGDNLTQRAIGVSYIYRRPNKDFTAQLGIAYVLERSETFSKLMKELTGADAPPVMLIYSIGWWF